AYERSGCTRYTAALEASLREMHRQTKVIVRHLVLPAGVAAPEKLMPRIAAVSKAICVNVLSQYRPLYRASRFPVIARGVTDREVSGAIEAARSAGLRHILMDGRPVCRLVDCARRHRVRLKPGHVGARRPSGGGGRGG